MGKIDVISKWNLNLALWEEASHDLRGRSFALANYDPVINSSYHDVNYIIFSWGNRVEDLSKDTINIKNHKAQISTILNYLKKASSANYNVIYYMLDADAPLIEDAKKLAALVDNLSLLPNTCSINIMGHSKCGTINMYIPRFFQNEKSFDLTSIYNISTPYSGTILASPLIFYPKVKDLIISKFGNGDFSNKIYISLINLYESISSNSHMDYDIAKNGGIPKELLNKYDESFIQNIACKENIDAIKNISSFKNFTTRIDKQTLSKAMIHADFASIGLCLLDNWFFENDSDGFVQTSDQKIIEEYLSTNSIDLISTHNLGTSKEFYKVLNEVSINSENKHFQRLRR